MLEKLLRRLIPQVIGFLLIIMGWYVSIINVGLDKLTSPTVLTKWSFIGLSITLLGAYLPQIWIMILNKMAK